MKKLLSLLLALAMFAGLALPAMAEEPVTIEFWYSFENQMVEQIMTVIAAFEAAETVTALKEAATRLGIPENHPDSEAIYAAYRERQRKIEAQDKERAA